MTTVNPANPLIVQGDHTVLLEVDNPRYAACRDKLARFAELLKSPEHIHTYRIMPLSIWNACAAKMDAEAIVASLSRYAKYPVPAHVATEIRVPLPQGERMHYAVADARAKFRFHGTEEARPPLRRLPHRRGARSGTRSSLHDETV